MADDPNFGTTPFYFVPKTSGLAPALPPGNYYLAVRLHSARVVYRGGWWDPVKAVAITTTASFAGGTAPAVGVKSVNTAIRKSGGQGGVGTGIQKLVVQPTPATMETLTIGSTFTVTRRDVVNEFFQLAQQDAFSVVLGLSPGAVAAVKAVSAVVPALITLFKGDAPEKEDALAVAVELPLQGGALREGYYVALAAQGKNDEIPRLQSAEQLTVREREVELDGQPLRQVCYVVLELMTFPAKDIDGSGELWVRQYRKTMKALDDLITGITPAGEKERVLSESLKGIYTVDALQAEDPSFTQKDKDYWRKRLADTYKQAQTLTVSGNLESVPVMTADIATLVREERERVAAEEAYQRELDLSRQKLADFYRPANITAELVDAAGAEPDALTEDHRLVVSSLPDAPRTDGATLSRGS